MELSPLSPDLEQAKSLLRAYSFDLGGWQEHQLLVAWHQEFDPAWIPMAIVEALYQGRYKVVSVHQILRLWSRRGCPLRHFNGDFDRMICSSIDPCQQRTMSPLSLGKSSSSTASTTDEPGSPESPSSDPSSSTARTSSKLVPSRFTAEGDTQSTALNTSKAVPPTIKALPASEPNSLSCRQGKSVKTHDQEMTDHCQSVSLTAVTSNAQDSRSSVVNAEHHQPIQPFIPEGQHSLFYHRLQAVAQIPYYSGSY